MSYLVLSASLNPSSRSRLLARAAADTLDALGVTVNFVDLQDYPLPLCDAAGSYSASGVAALTDTVRAADGILLATPIYNFDAGAAAKNFIELTGDAWTGKVVGFLCAAGGSSSYMAVMSLANSLMLDFRCFILPRFVYATGDDFDGDTLAPPVQARVAELAAALVQVATALR